MKTVKRFDAGELRSPSFTPEGFLKCDALVTRTGVFKYMMSDGSVRLELRHPDDVFEEDSLASLHNIPVTNEHPWQSVTAENWKEFAVGNAGNNIAPLDQFVKADLTITDKKSVEDVTQKRKDQVSCGYDCTIELMPGVWNGEPYDARQKNIRYNHVALVPYGRGGDKVKIKLDQCRLDSADAICADFVDEKQGRPSKMHSHGKDSRNDLSSKKTEQISEEQMTKIKIDGVEYEVSEVAAKAVLDSIAKKDSEIQGLKSKNETLQGRADALEAENKLKADELVKARADSLDENKALEIARIRLDVEATAKELVGDDFEMEKLSVSEIKKAVVGKISESDVAAKSDEYIDGMFEVYKKSIDAAEFSSLKKSVSQTLSRDEKPKSDSNKLNRYDAYKTYRGPGTFSV